MKVVILAGGKGTRLSEETVHKPKPMVEVANAPIITHIMDIYSQYGYNDFVIALGYKGELIKDYFLNYHYRQNDINVNLDSGSVSILNAHKKKWKVTLIDTGLDTMTGGRLRRLQPYLNDEPFMLTYGDGLATVDLEKLKACHDEHQTIATVTAVRPSARFGALNINNHKVTRFKEKSQVDEGWINGGFFVFTPAIFDFIDSDQTILEQEPLEQLTKQEQLTAYKHDDYWRCMDTLRDKEALCNEWPEQIMKQQLVNT